MNGWTNSATWRVWTEMQNVESTYLFWQEQVKALSGRDAIINRLAGYYGDESGINFSEIADALLDE